MNRGGSFFLPADAIFSNSCNQGEMERLFAAGVPNLAEFRVLFPSAPTDKMEMLWSAEEKFPLEDLLGWQASFESTR